MTYDENRRKWHVGKEIPIATIAVLLMQTVGVIWWAASTAAKIDYIEKTSAAAQILQASVDRRQDDEAKRTEDRIVIQLDRVNLKLDQLMVRK